MVEDEEIISMFFQRNDAAIGELDRKYGKLCHKTAHNILRNRQDAEECVSDAYLGVWNIIPPQKPLHLSAFLLKIVRNISLSKYRSNTAQKRNSFYDIALEEIEETLSSSGSVEKHVETELITRAIESFLDTLDKESRVVFIRRYWFGDSYDDIALLTGLSSKNVSVKLTRLRKKLKDYLISQEVI